MKQEIKSVLKKTAKIAGVTCLAVGSIAVLTSGVALKAISEGGKYLAGTVMKIINENDGVVEGDVVAEEDFAVENAAPTKESITAEPEENI